MKFDAVVGPKLMLAGFIYLLITTGNNRFRDNVTANLKIYCLYRRHWASHFDSEDSNALYSTILYRR